MSRRREPKVRLAGRRAPLGLPAGVTLRDAIWQTFRGAGRITIGEAAEAGRCDRATARIYLFALVAAGIARRLDDEPVHTFEIANDPGEVTPRVRRDGTPLATRTGRDRAWQAMRILKRFNPMELHVATGIELADAKYYVKFLARAGYLAIVRKGSGPIATQYRLVESKYRGPLAPQILHLKSVWDPNIAEFVWTPGEEDEQ
ncbi:hypothetical protein [Segnochrobactrum spirostomi]|uniref:hypothetical protein n=1 Tax=Segnochrobactrum spirostomi TaxID=2608987 RepID=UPI001AD824CE|nr:hypothetical protein [Segnochrobactrum spirostomi]